MKHWTIFGILKWAAAFLVFVVATYIIAVFLEENLRSFLAGASFFPES